MEKHYAFNPPRPESKFSNCENQPYQCIFRPDHLPYEAASADVVLQISTDFHLELCPSIFKRFCAELQKKNTIYIYTLSTVC